VKITVSGLTAAGKTTHARRLADELGLPYFSASQIVSRLSGQPGPWSPRIDTVRAERDIDAEVDRHITHLFETAPAGVFDAWALPWLTAAPAIRVWIESDQPSRVRKAYVSELRRGRVPDEQAVQELVNTKDRFSQQQFKIRHKFDLFIDHDVFDIVIDNSAYIPVASIAASDHGIESFHPVFLERIVRTAGLSMP
jgi:cytidylate kinase